jgi:hypothetical protein
MKLPVSMKLQRAAAAAAVAAAPVTALACPVCAQGADTPWVSLLIGAMIAAPYVVVGLVVRAIRSAEDER